MAWHIQQLEQLVMMMSDGAGPSRFPGSAPADDLPMPMSALTPEGSCPSTPQSPTWLHMSQSEKDGIAPLVTYLTKPRAATAPPMIPKHKLTEEMMEDDIFIPDEEDESLWRTYLANCQGALDVEDLYNNCDDD